MIKDRIVWICKRPQFPADCSIKTLAKLFAKNVWRRSKYPDENLYWDFDQRRLFKPIIRLLGFLTAARALSGQTSSFGVHSQVRNIHCYVQKWVWSGLLL